MFGYLLCICARCKREYYYWKEKGLFASKKFCPDCNIIRKSKEITGLPIEQMAGGEQSLDKVWANKQVIRLLIKTAGLTDKQKEAVKSFLKTNTIPRNCQSYYLAIRKMKAVSKELFK